MSSSLMRRLAMSMPDLRSFYNNSTASTTIDHDTTTRMDQHEQAAMSLDTPTTVDHEYVSLHFTDSVLTAMKAHGMMMVNRPSSSSSLSDALVVNVEDDNPSPYVSTNDLVTAVCWLFKRQLSRRDDWNLAVVVNLRGRCGVGTFHNQWRCRDGDNTLIDDHDLQHKAQQHQRSGLFGNARSASCFK